MAEPAHQKSGGGGGGDAGQAEAALGSGPHCSAGPPEVRATGAVSSERFPLPVRENVATEPLCVNGVLRRVSH